MFAGGIEKQQRAVMGWVVLLERKSIELCLTSYFGQYYLKQI